MKSIQLLGLAVFVLSSCDQAASTSSGIVRRVYVGVAEDLESWPYRYTLINDGGKWQGAVEFCDTRWGGLDQSIYFDTLNILSSTPRVIKFGSLIGVPGKSLGMAYSMSLTPTDFGFDAILVADVLNEFEPIKIRLVETPGAKLPSPMTESELSALRAEQVGAQNP